MCTTLEKNVKPYKTIIVQYFLWPHGYGTTDAIGQLKTYKHQRKVANLRIHIYACDTATTYQYCP